MQFSFIVPRLVSRASLRPHRAAVAVSLHRDFTAFRLVQWTSASELLNMLGTPKTKTPNLSAGCFAGMARKIKKQSGLLVLRLPAECPSFLRLMDEGVLTNMVKISLRSGGLRPAFAGLSGSCHV